MEEFIVKNGKRIYNRFFNNLKKKLTPASYYPNRILSEEEGNQLISEKLMSGKPYMVTRYGSVEINTIINYLEINELTQQLFYKRIISQIRGKSNIWQPKNCIEIERNAGFFPVNDHTLRKFAEYYIESSKHIDALGVWFNYGEQIIHNKFFPQAKLIPLRSIEPYYFGSPWSQYLKNKKVLVIHPFEKSIHQQFGIKNKLFHDKRILPDFQLITIKAIQSNSFNKTCFTNWFDALDNMKKQMEETDFDIALIGAGAYGLPLAAYAKELGKQAIHFGGSLQILFGIKGQRWDSMPEINKLHNEHWIRPSQEETPDEFRKVEDGCYW